MNHFLSCRLDACLEEQDAPCLSWAAPRESAWYLQAAVELRELARRTLGSMTRTIL